MKKKGIWILLIILLSLLPLQAIFRTTDLLHTHDGLVHLPRIAAFYKAVVSGHFPVRWAGDLNYGFGLPLFNFIYPLPYLISSIFLYFGLGLVMSFKLSLALSFCLSGVFMYLAATEYFGDKKKGFLVAVFYQFATFRFIELLTRGSFGEVYTYTFLPLLFYAVLRLIKEKTPFNFALTSLSTALLVLSHNSISLVFFGCIVLFVLLFSEDRKNLVYIFSALFLGLLTSSFYWVPALLEHKYTYGNLFMKDLYKSHFAPLQNFFIPNIFNSKLFQIEGIAVQLGLFQVIGMFLSLWFLFKKTKIPEKKVFIYSLTLLFLALFFMQPVSTIFWEKISFLRQFQFPWRLLSVTVFASALLSVVFLKFKFFNKTIGFTLLVSGVILSSVVFWEPALGYDKIKEQYYWNFPLNTTYYGETDLVWSAGPAKKYPQSRVEIASGRGKIENYMNDSTRHEFNVTGLTPVTVVLNVQFYPGWRAFVDNNEVPIQFQDANYRGLITFNVPKNEHSIVVKFEETKLRIATDIVSGISFAFVLLLIAISIRHRV